MSSQYQVTVPTRPSTSGQRWVAALVVMIAMALAQSVKVQSHTMSQPATKQILFDGKTLDGWKKTDLAHAGAVKVDQGRIVLETGNAMTAITTTRRDLPRVNYELSYSAMRLEGTDFFAAGHVSRSESLISPW